MKYLYFSAGWCGPCRMLKPVMAQVGEKIPVELVDVDGGSDLVIKHGIRSIPTVLLVDEAGEPVERLVGVRKEGEYLKTWEQNGGKIG